MIPSYVFGPNITVTRKEDYWYHDPFQNPWKDSIPPLQAMAVQTVPTYEIEFENFAPWLPPKELIPGTIPYLSEFNNYVKTEAAEAWPSDYQWKLFIKFAEEDFPLDETERAKLWDVEYKEHYTKPLSWQKNRIMTLWMYNVAIQMHSNKGIEACEKLLSYLYRDIWDPIHKKMVLKRING